MQIIHAIYIISSDSKDKQFDVNGKIEKIGLKARFSTTLCPLLFIRVPQKRSFWGTRKASARSALALPQKTHISFKPNIEKYENLINYSCTSSIIHASY